MNSKEFPSRIYLIDDEFNNTMWSCEPSPFGEVDEDSIEYIKAKDVEEMLAEQRQLCADDAFNQCQLLYLTDEDSEAISNACLNATGESDDN